MIAVTGQNYQGLWVMNAEGDQLRQLSDEIGAGYGFAWSSDSREIVARVSKYENKRRYNAVKVFEVDKGTSRMLTGYRTLMTGLPQWIDGDQRVYIYGNKGLEIFQARRSGPGLQKEGRGSSRIVGLGKQGLVTGKTDGKLKKLQPVKGQYLNAVLSPDGLKIAFEVVGGNLYVLNVDGSGLVDLGEGYRPQWSPDSQWIVYMITRDDGHRYLASDIYAVRADGRGKVNLTSTEDRLEMNPSWSPDGRSVAYDVMGEGRIYLIGVEIRP